MSARPARPDAAVTAAADGTDSPARQHQVADVLRERILQGERAPGARLVERTLAA